jgi:hypothetical protein
MSFVGISYAQCYRQMKWALFIAAINIRIYRDIKSLAGRRLVLISTALFAGKDYGTCHQYKRKLF